MKRAKILSLLLAGILSLGALTGCNQSAPSSGAESDSSSASVSDGSGQGEETANIVWYRFGFNSSGDYTTALHNVSEELNNYLKEKINLTVDMQCFSSKEYGTKLSLAMASQEQVDLFWTGSTYNMLTPNELIEDKAVYDLTELVENNVNLYGYMSEEIWNTSRYDGKLYFVPNFKDMGRGGGLMFNAELVKKSGFDVSTVKKLADLEPFFAAIAEECSMPCSFARLNSGAFGTFLTFTENNPYIYLPFGVNCIAYDMTSKKVVNLAELESYEETLNTLRDFNQKGYIPSWMATDTDSSKANEYQKNNDYGVTNAGVYPAYESFWLANYGHEGKYLLLSDILIDRNNTLGSAYAVPAYSKNPEAAVRFLELLETDKVVGDFARYGVKNENYTVDAEGYITAIADSGYSFPSFATTSLLNMSLLKGQSSTTYEDTVKFVDETVESPLYAFAFETTGVKAELAAISEVLNGYSLLGTGDMDVAAALPELRAALQEAGIDKVIQEAQKQVDAYLQGK